MFQPNFFQKAAPKASGGGGEWSDDDSKPASGPNRGGAAGRGRGGSYADRGSDRPARGKNFSFFHTIFISIVSLEPRPGDWNCECGANNFSNKTACFKCQADKPEGAGGGGRPARGKKSAFLIE